MNRLRDTVLADTKGVEVYRGKKIGVVTAAYNEERIIRETVQTIPSFVDRIFVTNDCSTDGTGDILASIHDDRLVVINHEHRMGAGAATLSGYKRACEERMDVVGVMAGDGQMDPAILDKILDPVVEGKADYSKGNRLTSPERRRGMPKWRLFGNFLLTYIIKVASGYWHIVDPLNGYTAITQDALTKINLDRVERGYAFETDLLVKLNACNARVVNVPMAARYRREKSKIVYAHFITYTSWVILRDHIWRLWTKYVRATVNKAATRQVRPQAGEATVDFRETVEVASSSFPKRTSLDDKSTPTGGVNLD